VCMRRDERTGRKSHNLDLPGAPQRMPAEPEPHRQSSRRRTYAPARGALVFRIPEHDVVEIERLGLRAPVAVDAEARLCVDVGGAVAAGALAAFRPGGPGGGAE